MDAKSIGSTIARLRKKRGMTQTALAERLKVSNKAVSKWESGQGYPDITLFPLLASIFDVTIDYLMLGEKKGIVIAGNLIVDIVKTIDSYPKTGMLTNIRSINNAIGGCAANTAVDIAKLDRSVPVSVIGRVGMDENGRFIISQLQKYGIDIDKIKLTSTTDTAFTDVMSMPSGERTFFHKPGSNAEFCPEDVDIDSLNCEIFHIGYILLLDKFDEKDPEYGTVMARFLHDLQMRGIKTSIDVVSSENLDDYGSKIIPALKYSNYAIMNEIEATAIWKLPSHRPDGTTDRETVRIAMMRMVECGVKDKVIVHAKEISFLLDARTGEFCEVHSLKIPADRIKGSVGAGDAFCAGCLYGIFNGYENTQMLEFASAVAASNLFAANSVDGILSKNEILQIANEYERLK